MRSTVVTPSATTMPGGKLERAISTPSSGCRRMTGAWAMGCLLWLLRPLLVLYGESVGRLRRPSLNRTPKLRFGAGQGQGTERITETAFAGSAPSPRRKSGARERQVKPCLLYTSDAADDL